LEEIKLRTTVREEIKRNLLHETFGIFSFTSKYAFTAVNDLFWFLTSVLNVAPSMTK